MSPPFMSTSDGQTFGHGPGGHGVGLDPGDRRHSVSSFRVPASKNKVVEKEPELQDIKDKGEFRGDWNLFLI